MKPTHTSAEPISQPITIVVNRMPARELTKLAITSLEYANSTSKTLYVMNEVLMRLIRVANKLRIEIVNYDKLAVLLEDAADYYRSNGHENFPIPVPKQLPRRILKQDMLPFPPLHKIVFTPTYTRTGKLIVTHGYDSESGMYLNGENLGQIDTEMSLATAKKWLLVEVFGDFPFENPQAGLAHVLALLLTPFVREMIQAPIPLFLGDAPTLGSGKTLLMDIIIRIATGHSCHISSLPSREEEIEKRITAILMKNPIYNVFDNVSSVQSEALAALLTSTNWTGRVLQRSEMVEFHNDCIWVVTGNNVELADDFPRRTLPIRLQPQTSRPEFRSNFRHPDLRKFVMQNRTQLISACITLVEHWKRSGCPMGRETMASFEPFSRIIGGILESCGIPGFLTGRDYLYRTANSEPNDWALVLKIGFERYGSRAITARDLLTIAQQHDVLHKFWTGYEPNAALQKFGRAMSSVRNRIFGLLMLTATTPDRQTNSNRFAIIPHIPPQSPANPE
jgi:hypothetical protein